jgi:hypothetical protein
MNLVQCTMRIIANLANRLFVPRRESIDYLQNEGHLYATIDEYHVKSAESF